MKFCSKDFESSPKNIDINPVNTTFEQANEIADINAFVKRTYQLLAGSLIAGAVGAYVGMGFVGNMTNYVTGSLTFTYWGAVILEFILLFGVYIVKNKIPLNLVLLFAFISMTGFILASTLAIFVAANMGYVISEVFGLTAVVLIAFTIIFAINTKKDFSTMGGILFILLIVIVAANIANIFLHLPTLQLVIAVSGQYYLALLFYTIHKT